MEHHQRSETLLGTPSAFVAGAGALVAFFVAIALTALPGGRPTTSVTVLVLVAIVVGVAGVGGTMAGVTTGAVAALSFNFFHTEPYLSLRIHGSADLVTFGLLAAVGVMAGSLAGRAAKARGTSTERREGIVAVHRVAELAASGAGELLLRSAVERTLLAELDLSAVEWRAGEVPGSVAKVGRRGTLDLPHYRYTGHGFEVPDGGLALAVVRCGTEVGWFHLFGRPGVGATKEQLLVAVTLADIVSGAWSTEVEPR